MDKRIAFAGEVMGELRRGSGGFSVGFAGDTFNSAIYCKRALGPSGQVSYLTRIGNDPLSRGALDLAAEEGIDTSHIRRDRDRNLGLYSVQTDDSGERSFAYWRDQSAARMLFTDPAELAALETVGTLCLSGITLAILSPRQRNDLFQKISDLRKSGQLMLAFDSNYRPSLWEDKDTARKIIQLGWELTDIALPSVDDEMALFGDQDEAAALSRLRGMGLSNGAMKRGDRGPLPMDPSAELFAGFHAAEKVVDTTAAGDSFNGGFLAAYLQGQSLDACMHAGHEIACEVVAHPGAIISAK